MTQPEVPAVGFSSAKRELLVLLRQRPDLSLAQIAAARHVSKVAVLHHLAALENEGFVERSYEHGAVGRPSAHFRLSPKSTGIFPQAYTQMSLTALDYIERRLGRDAVVAMLQERAHDLVVQTHDRLREPALRDRVRSLARIRAEGGYMAEIGGTHGRTTELREHNCPILAIAGKYPEACEVERRMFERMLQAQVQTSHRVVAGDPVCRFLVRPRSEPP